MTDTHRLMSYIQNDVQWDFHIALQFKFTLECNYTYIRAS